MTFRTRASTALAALPRQAITQTGGLTLGTGVARLGALLAAVIVARTLGRADLGRYAAALAIGAIVVSGPGSGLPIMALREVAAGRAGRSFAIRAARGELLVTAVATGVAVLVTMAFIGRGMFGAELGLVAGLGNVALTQLNLALCLGLGLKRFRLAIAIQVATGLLLPAATLLSVRIGLGVTGAVAALAVSAVPCSVLAFCALRGPIASLPDLVDTNHLVWRSRTFIGLAAVNGGYQRVDSVITLAVAGAGATGTYASAYRLLGPFDLLAASFAQVFFPRLSTLQPESREWKDIRRRGTHLYCLAVLPLAVITMILMPAFITGLFGASFHSAITPARVLMLSVVPSALYLPDSLALIAAGRESVVLYLFLISMTLDVILVVALAGPLGAAGPAWAWVAAECSLWIGLRLAVKERFNQTSSALQ